MSGRVIDLNADLGEGMGDDAAMMAVVTSCSVACGGHAGDEASMVRTVRLARDCGVAVGAHPSYPDKEGFGRRSPRLPLNGGALADLEASLTAQILALREVAEGEGVPLAHLKAHGALYNDAARHEALATLLVGLAARLLPGASLYGPPGAATEQAAAAAGVVHVAEGFADRAYRADGTLVPRSDPGAVVARAARPGRAVRLALTGTLEAQEGGTVSLPVRTICLHGDAAGAGAGARAVRAALQAAGVLVAAPGRRTGPGGHG